MAGDPPVATPEAPAAKKNGASSSPAYLVYHDVDSFSWCPDKKEKAKADKAAKFAAKQQAKQQQQQPVSQAAPKAKAQTPTLPPYKDETPLGEKKIIQPFDHPHFSAYNPSAVESAWYQVRNTAC